MGGMSSIAYAMRYPGEIANLISISAAASALPLTIALRSLQREIIRSDPDWNQGRYTDDSKPLVGMSLARKLGLVSYRAADEWNSKFDRSRLPEEERSGQRFAHEFQIENYLEYKSGENPYAGKRNTLTRRQVKRRQRIMRHAKR